MPRGFVNRRDRFRWDNVHFPDGENPLSSDSVSYDGQTLTQALDRIKEGIVFLEATPGATVTFETASTEALEVLNVAIAPTQAGSGTPAPDNVRAITGYTSCTISHSDGVNTPTTYTLNFGAEAGTVYSGTLDVVTGVLTVDKVGRVLDGSEEWTKLDAGKFYAEGIFEVNEVAFTSTSHFRAASMCNEFDPRGNGASTSSDIIYDKSIYSARNRGRVWIYYSDCTDVSDLVTYLTSNPCTVVFPLATAKTYQLTPEVIHTLQGDNVISADTGDITALTYQDSFNNEVIMIWRAIESLDARVTALGG